MIKFNQRKDVDFYKTTKECLEINLLPKMENVLVAHHRQIEFSRIGLEHIYKEVDIVAKQQNLQIQFIEEESGGFHKLSVNYDVLDMMYAMTILERSIIEN
tara:strand:+ start:120 stop:422 length:303 start_codon:yes stop_codon:yes gene_type:complete